MKTKNLIKILMVSGAIFSAQYSFAQSVPFPGVPYTTATMQSAGCDPNVYNRMYTQAANRFNAAQPVREQLFVKNQIEASPKNVTNSMLSCVDNAVRQLDGLVGNVMGIYNMITGAGNIDLAALGSKAVNQLSQMACNTVNNYTGGAVYSAVSPYNSAMTSLPGTVSGAIGSVGTPFGNVNVGQMVTGAVQQQSGGPVTSTIVKDTVTNTVGTVGGVLK
jgi:hypothetical protein